MKKIKFDLRILYLFIPLFLLELIFHSVQFQHLDIYTLIRMFTFDMFLSSAVFLICRKIKKKKLYFTVSLIILIWYCAYSFVELIFKNFMGDFYSFGTVSDGALRIAQYALIFLSNAKPAYYLCFLPLIVFFLMHRFIRFNGYDDSDHSIEIAIICLIILIFSVDLGSGTNSIREVYRTFSNKSIIIDKMGIEHFFVRDLTALVYKAPEAITIEEEIVEESEVKEIVRSFDDTAWKNMAANEENANIKMVDNYLINKTVTQPNDKTGKFKDYNFIYFMVEALDYLAIDEQLTPTLYKMYKDGNTFYNHYTPLYSCATGESEFVSYTSLFPYMNVCTPNYVAGDQFYEALPYLFKNKGYSTFALHNWRDEFYERKIILPAMGFDNYYDIEEIWKDPSIPHTSGWQSDAMLIEQAIKHIDESKGRFFCNIITSVMHFPYDESSYWGDHYLSQVNEVHPEWGINYKRYMSKCMDFDNGLKILLEYLQKTGKADNTVICIYPDHRPYWMDYETVMSYTRHLNKDRSGEYGIYRSPFIIYNPATKGEVNYNFCSTLDHVPTIANLFDLDYDPRLYLGADAYNGNNTVIFANGDWLNDKGVYNAIKESFTPYEEGSEVSQDYVKRISNQVSNTIKISYLILDEKYFANRRSICSH